MESIEFPSIPENDIKSLCEELLKNNSINPNDYVRYQVKRGLRNADGTGVVAGLSKICSVEGYYISDGERVPMDGRLIYRGMSIQDIISNCEKENRFGFEEVAWLLIFGSLPTQTQLQQFSTILAQCRDLPDEFIEDMIMKFPSPDIMNKIARSVLALYSFDSAADDLSVPNVLRQSIQLIAQVPAIMVNSWQVKRRTYYHQSMFLHPNNIEHSTAQFILNSLRPDMQFTDEEAKILDICLMIHAEHGGGNNSTFSTRLLTSSGTDTYSAIAAGIGSLKGPRHGGANIKVTQMIDFMKEEVRDITNEKQVADFLRKVIRKEAGDRTGLIYGMGHAVYTNSDPRAVLLKKYSKSYAEKKGYGEDFKALELVERLTPEIIAESKGDNKRICANVDLYSGLVYKCLDIPQDLFTPMFASARIAGWSAHRIEELVSGGRIFRPAYKSVCYPQKYIPIAERTEPQATASLKYIPKEERR
ncbi:MAG: citrate synthase [Clostridiales bacterium]|nr:citrate synthase [Clostridiales bacterium]